MVCEICGKETKGCRGLGTHVKLTHKIETKKYYDTFLKKDGDETCKRFGCDNRTTFTDLSLGYNKYCSRICSNIDNRERNSKSLLGHRVTETTKEKIRERNKQKTLSKETKMKISEKLKSEEVRKKIKETCLKNFGVENPMKREEIKEKTRDTMMKRYGVENPSKLPEVRRKISEYMKNGGATHSNSFVKNPSGPQVKIYNNVKELYSEALIEYWVLDKYRLDIAILSLKIDIEYDGKHWHQDQEKDRKRDEELESLGWKVLRYKGLENKDIVPSKEQVKKDIEGLNGRSI